MRGYGPTLGKVKKLAFGRESKKGISTAWSVVSIWERLLPVRKICIWYVDSILRFSLIQLV